MSTVPVPRGTNTELRSRRWVLLSAIVLGFAALLAYANSFAVPLLFDDWVTILHNPRLRQLWPLWSALSPPENTGVGGRPIANLSFVLNYAVTGESIPGFHAVNLAIHFLAGLTLFGIVHRTLRLPRWSGRIRGHAGALALTAAALWLLQPVQTQSVTYVSQRTESLMGLFYFLTLYSFIRGVESGAPRGWFVAAVTSCFAGMATKEGMVTVPVIVLLYDFVFVSRSFVQSWRRRWILYLALASSWVLLAVLMAGLHGRGVGFGLGMSMWSYLLIEGRAVLGYLSLGIWPAPLVFDYGTDLGSPGTTEVLAALTVAALGVGSAISLWRAPTAGFLGAWFLITLAPTSSVVPIPLQPISENRIYVPTAAVITALVLLVHHFAGSRSLRALAVAGVALAGLTAARNRDYRSEINIWADTVAKRPDSARAHSNLGHALQSAGRLAEAKQHHETALRIRPAYVEAHVNLAGALGQLGDVDGAIAHSRRATQVDPTNASGYYNLGVALTQKGEPAGAIAAYEAALRTGRGSAETQSNLAVLLLQAGRTAEAIAHSEAVLQNRPDFVTARFTLACGLALTGRGALAIPLFQEVVRAQPTHLDAFQNLGTVLSEAGRIPEAIAAFEAAVRLNPNHGGANFALGNALVRSGRFTDAIPRYETAVRTSPTAEVHLNLGIALMQVNRRDEALKHFETALQLNPQLKAARDNLAILRNGAPRTSP